MPYQDTWATCADCGEQFIFRIEEQRRQEQQGEQITPPDVCTTCRHRARSRAAPRAQPRHDPGPRPRPEKKPTRPATLGHGPHEGTVKWYSSEKGYGFIVHPSGDEVFFHYTGIAPGEGQQFPDGTRVTYLIEETERGPQAVEVERMDAGEPPGEAA